MKLTYDYLPNTQIYLHQRKDMFRMNTDTTLLGNFMKIKDDDDVMDIGTNNGALLLYAHMHTKGKLIGVEIQKEAAELAIQNLKQYTDNFEIIQEDIQNVVHKEVDVIVCNPPYFKVTNEKQMNESEYKRIARHECYLTLETLCKKTSELLKEKGRFYLVHRSDRLIDICCELRKNQLEIKTLQFIRDEENNEAHGVLIEAVKKGLSHCKVLPEKIVTR